MLLERERHEPNGARVTGCEQLEARRSRAHDEQSLSQKPEKEISNCETQKKMKLTESLSEGRKIEAQRGESVPIIHCFHADWACQRPDDLTS